jgi:hypothetical protein
MTAADFRRIRWSLLLALVMVGIGASAVYFAQRATLLQRDAAQAARNRAAEAHNKLARARSEEAELRLTIGRFDALLQNGIIGTEQRLEWVERIKHIRAARGLYDLQYEIAPQRPLEGSVAPGASGDFVFMASEMRLQMDLLHEEDLLRFLDDLRVGISAYVRPDRCTITRQPASSPTGRGSGTQLKADCVVSWITIREREPGT